MKKTKAIALLSTAALILQAERAPAWAQSGVQRTPDLRRTLVSKDVGDERWAISYDLDDHTITGNVFTPGGGAPSFVWCERTGDDGNPDPRAALVRFRCRSAATCRDSGCGLEDWSPIDGEVTLPGSFFLAPEAQVPVPTDPAALHEYLVRGEYRTFEHESAIHPSSGPHGGRVLSFINQLLDRSLRAGDVAHPAGAASVKELYASVGDELVGWAVSVKTRGDSAGGGGWYWYEVFGAGAGAKPSQGQGNRACTGCHAAGRDYVRIPYPLQ